MDETQRAFFESYCNECHNAEKQKGKLRLDTLSFLLDTPENAERWQKILNQINSGEMPPEDSKKPDPAAKTEFLEALSKTLVIARKALSDQHGNITMRRLNRREYKNTLRDLLGVEVDARDLPADGGAGAFDTVGSALFMSSDQFEQYLTLGRKALDEATLRLKAAHSQIFHHHVEPEESANPQIAKLANGLEDGFRRWKAWSETQGTQPPTAFQFADKEAAELAKLQFEQHKPYLDLYRALPFTQRGAYLTIYEGVPRLEISVPKDKPPGAYILRIRIGSVPGTPTPRHAIQVGFNASPTTESDILGSYPVTASATDPQILEIPIQISPDGRRDFFIQEKQPLARDAAFALWNEARTQNGAGPTPALWVDWIEMEGPQNALPPPPRKVRYEPEKAGHPISVQSRHDEEIRLHEAFEKWKAAGSGDTKPFGLADKAAIEFGEYCYQKNKSWFSQYLALPKIKEGTYLWNAIHDVDEIPIHIPKDAPDGDYLLRVRIGKVPGMPEERGFLAIAQGQGSESRGLFETRQIKGSVDAPEVLEIPVHLSAHTPRSFYLMERRPMNERREELNRRWRDIKDEAQCNPVLWVDWVEWEGPIPAKPIAFQRRSERREVETWANRDIKGLYSGYYLGGFKSAKQWMAAEKTSSPKDFGLPDKEEAKFRVHVFETHGPSFAAYLANPLSENGSLLTIYNVHSKEFISLPPEPATPGEKPRNPIPPGDYILRLRIGCTKEATPERSFLEMGIDSKEGGFAPKAAFQITGSVAKPQILEIPVKITPDGPRTFSFREKIPNGAEFETYMESQRRTGVGPAPALWIDWVEWDGPIISEPKEARFAALWKSAQEIGTSSVKARELLEAFTLLAFRDQRPDVSYLDRLTQLFTNRLQAGETPLEALKEPMSVVLASPGFLYLNEPASSPKPRPLSPQELAVRLSYFLWSAPPDQPLLELARSGELSKPAVLQAQVERLLADPRAYELVTGLTRQWLGLDRLDFFQFNTKLFPSFDESTKASAKAEVYRTVELLLRENLPLSRLLKSDFVVINGLLAHFYGIEGVSGDEFRKVSLPADSPRGGLLGMSAILAMGTNGEHTSPVERGAWVLRKILNDPPPPAPANVPQLTRLEGKLLTTRERLLAHQEEPQCAQCHRKIDPIGFGLENFNTVGLWRTKDHYEKKGVGKKEWDIDPSGAFHKGPSFQSFFELRDRIAEQPDRLARGFTEALMEYALGRPVGFSDEALVQSIVQRAGQKQFALREFLFALTSSTEFHSK